MTARTILLGLAIIASAHPSAAPAAPAANARPAARDWSHTVVATAEGGFRMGNPAAKVKLVEYGSLTCGHCANFARAGVASLVGTYVRSGKVSYEYRNFILNGLDVAASLVARCGGASRFFPIAAAGSRKARKLIGRSLPSAPARAGANRAERIRRERPRR